MLQVRVDLTELCVCELSYYLINSLMKAGPAGSGVCPIDLCTFTDQQFYNLLVPTVYSCWKKVSS